MRSERGSSYVAEISTPSGLTFHTEIYVPPDAEHAAQHELAEIAHRHCSHMFLEHLGRELYVAAEIVDEDEPDVDRCPSRVQVARSGLTLREQCILTAGHEGQHTWSGDDPWSSTIPPDPFLGKRDPAEPPPI